jgi:hypothetical protein
MDVQPGPMEEHNGGIARASTLDIVVASHQGLRRTEDTRIAPLSALSKNRSPSKMNESSTDNDWILRAIRKEVVGRELGVGIGSWAA